MPAECSFGSSMVESVCAYDAIIKSKLDYISVVAIFSWNEFHSKNRAIDVRWCGSLSLHKNPPTPPRRSLQSLSARCFLDFHYIFAIRTRRKKISFCGENLRIYFIYLFIYDRTDILAGVASQFALPKVNRYRYNLRRTYMVYTTIFDVLDRCDLTLDVA